VETGNIFEGVVELTNGNFEDGLTDKGIRPDGVEKFFPGDELALAPEGDG
jgi:hypothetical protein